MLKRNQIMITALAIMIAVAGYLNFAGTKAGQEQLASADAQNAEEEDMTALLDLSEEDIVSDLDSANVSDIESLDSDQEAAAVENYLDESMSADGALSGEVEADVAVAAESIDEASAELAQEGESVSDSGTPG